MQAFLALSPIQFDYEDHPAREEIVEREVPTGLLDANEKPVTKKAREKVCYEKARTGVKGVIGLSAEELHKAGLTEMLNYDSDGLPYSLREHAIIAYLLSIVKSQESRISALEKPQ